jgi:predicted naringenin-chalcone synthase
MSITPDTRGKLWEMCAKAMAIESSRAAIKAWSRGSASDITHVVTHSCTGFSAPGIDFFLINELGLKPSTRKLGVNFMGCFGGFSAMYVAKQIVEADKSESGAVVLVCCVETCSLHVSDNKSKELIVGNTLFADGSSAAIITRADFSSTSSSSASGTPGGSFVEKNTEGMDLTISVPNTSRYCGWVLGNMMSEIVSNSAEAMTWKQSITAGKYDMFLDKAIPKALSSLFLSNGISMLTKVGISNVWNCGWAIHPGGKGILSTFEKSLATLGIQADGVQHSYDVLSQYGNMSSATILFVLKRVLSSSNKNEVFTCGFGPGLSVEYGRLFKTL